jgi:hypothetical protein
MLENSLDLMKVRDKGDDAHLGTAFSTAQGIHFEDTADEPRPGRGWFTAGRAFPGVDKDKFGFLLFLVLPPLFAPIAPGLLRGRAEGLLGYGDAVVRPILPDSFHG